ncbi:MAG TPA: hypothetical protein VMS64_10240 [Candidatus Methylomirabilis sp.]|nr:hypothetical protein [Candidatus Methylomirabilis sp.]
MAIVCSAGAGAGRPGTLAAGGFAASIAEELGVAAAGGLASAGVGVVSGA